MAASELGLLREQLEALKLDIFSMRLFLLSFKSRKDCLHLEELMLSLPTATTQD